MLLLVLVLMLSGTLLGQATKPVAHWSFDKIDQTETVKPLIRHRVKSPEVYRQNAVIDNVTGAKGQIIDAFHKSVPGVVGNALQLDGNTSYVASGPVAVSGDFSVGAWLALGAYPTHWCPVADQHVAAGRGFFVGIDALGHAGFRAFVGGKWTELQATERIPLRTWTHLQGVFSPTDGLILYVNGKPVATAKTADLLIGKSSIRQEPAGTVRPNATAEVNTFLDGIVDELLIFDTALSANDVPGYVKKTATKMPPALPARSLPLAAGTPDGAKPGKFGAIYTKLAYYEA